MLKPLASREPHDLIDAAEQIAPELIGQDWSPLFGGRTNQSWRVGTAVVKSYCADASSPLFPNDPSAEARALIALSGTGLGPDLISTGPMLVVYRHVDGQTGTATPFAVGAMLSRLHRLNLDPDLAFRQAPMGADLKRHALLIAGEAVEDLPPCPNVPDLRPASKSLIHGDAVAGNIIDAAGTPVLIDWQCPAWGDPVEDIAAYLSPAMQWLYGGVALTASDRDAFFAGYNCDVTKARYLALAPILHWRIAAHCQWKSRRGFTDYDRAVGLEINGLSDVQTM